MAPAVHIERRADGIVVDALAAPEARGLVLASAKADFCAGGDIAAMAAWAGPRQAYDATMAMKAVLRRMETQGKPVVAAIAGHALGGGLEIALACHARFALDDPALQIGQPEVKLGLLPAGGGTVRLSRLVGQRTALQWMVEGTTLTPHQALEAGLLHGLASNRDALLAQAAAWIGAHPRAVQPWDAPGFRFPGGDSRSPAAAQLFAVAPAMAAARGALRNPAVQAIMSAVYEGGLLDVDNALQVESRHFAAIATGPVAKALMQRWLARA